MLIVINFASALNYAKNKDVENKDELENKDVKITKIAHGIPMGADIDYIDPLTLEIALEGRSQIS